jgi:hypothetical protein
MLVGFINSLIPDVVDPTCQATSTPRWTWSKVKHCPRFALKPADGGARAMCSPNGHWGATSAWPSMIIRHPDIWNLRMVPGTWIHNLGNLSSRKTISRNPKLCRINFTHDVRGNDLPWALPEFGPLDAWHCALESKDLRPQDDLSQTYAKVPRLPG